MKKILVMFLLFGLMPNIAFASERNYIDLKTKAIKVKNNGTIGIQYPSRLSDTIVLVKGLRKSLDLSKFSGNQVNQEVTNFFERLVNQYKFRKSDRPYIAYAAIGNGFFGKGFYRLSINEITKLNGRDFGKKDLELVDSKHKVIPLKVLFSHLQVINPGTLKEDESATRILRNYIQQYKFGGSVGIIESMVENAWNRKTNKKVAVSESYTVVKKESGYDGVQNYYIACNSGGIRIITVNKSIGFYADSNSNRHSNFHSAAQASCGK